MRWLLCLYLLLIPPVVSAQSSSFINGLSHDGQDVTCDLPGSQQIGNIGSKVSSHDQFGRPYQAGMCVFTAIEMAAIHSGLEQMRGFRNWVAERYEGGGYPEKVDQCLKDYFEAHNMAPIRYVQYQGTSPDVVLKLCDKTGRMACMTYGYSPRYGRSVQHMVNGVGFKKYGIVLDNNYIGEDRMEWMLTKEIVRRSIYPNRSAWIFVWCAPPPPPSPRNLIRES